MPKYAKFLKDILTNKRKWTDDVTISLTENYSSIISKKIPTKLKDPGSFTIPCVVGDMEFSKCLCDLGASINLMPLSIFQKLVLGDVKETSMLLQLADQSIKRPHGRPFMNTGRVLIDVHDGKLIFRIGEDQVEFNMTRLIKHPLEEETCMRVDIIDECVIEEKDEESKIEDLKSVNSMDMSQEEEEFEPPRPELLLRTDKPTPPSTEKPPILELKPLPQFLRYSFLGENDILPIIIFNKLSKQQEERVID
ncbi:uncharacterized protein LOC126681748 [Mercurialis annua]|uniref:uncharacterized protein LOC126681748 n=1 Tax=Mercurialis annua TaxID=3986 RepID=UPI00215F3BCB|nr:uncharacterized protein LOC126681748 [Mercurialis annua]